MSTTTASPRRRPPSPLRAFAATGLLALLGAAPGACAATSPFTSATEDSTAGWSTIAEPLARALVAGGDAADRTLADETIRDEGLGANYRQFFRAHAIALGAAAPRARFVRAASAPRRDLFYGAHTFRFWIVDAQGRVLLASSADRVSLLASSHDGARDVLVSQCRGGTCFETQEIFTHDRYVDGACTARAIAGGQATGPCPR